jgi:TonB family protein
MKCNIYVAALLVALFGTATIVNAQEPVVFKTQAGEVERRAEGLPWPQNPPNRVKRVEPAWPNIKEAITGVVTLQITLATDGRVAQARPLQFVALGSPATVSDQPRIAEQFATSAKEAVSAWHYDGVGRTPVTFMLSLVIRPLDDGTSVRGTREVKVRHDNPALKKIRDVKPRYPSAAAHRGIQGVIVLEGTIGTDGRVLDARVLRAIPYLDQAALDAAVQWEFDPQALAGGLEPRSVVTQFWLNFTLQ